MVKKLLIRRKAFTTKKGTKVKATTFLAVDRGKPGRGKKIFPEIKEGTLGVKFSMAAAARRRILIKLAKKIGEKKVIGKLRAIQVFNKNVNPKLAKKALLDSKFIAKRFEGKKLLRKKK